MRVAFDHHQLRDVHASVFRDPADVIAAEIYEHDVLGAFFLVGAELGHQGFVLVGVTSTGPRAGNRSHGDAPALDTHQ